MSQKAYHKDANLDHVLKYTGVFGGVQGLNILISIIRNKLASTFLGAAGIGLMGFYIAMSELINKCANLGLPIASVQHISELLEQDRIQDIRRFVVTMRTWYAWGALLALIICAVADMLYDEPVLLLAPMAIALPLTAGELSILKGMRRLQRIALISFLSAIVTFAATIPFFWALGMQGIIIALDASTVAVLVVHYAFTLPLFPFHIEPFSIHILRSGLPLLKVGIPYVVTGIAAAGATFLLQAFLKEYISTAVLGYYRIGSTLMVTYAGIVFTALESDYFPRLSSVNHDPQRMNTTVNQQVRACILLMTPMLIALIITLPLLVPILFTQEFMPAVAMSTAMVFYMFFRCVAVPIEYIPLAKGQAYIFLIMEVIYNIAMLAIIIAATYTWQLIGVGIGFSLTALFDTLMVATIYRRTYHLRLHATTIRLTILQALVLAAAVGCCLLLPAPWKFIVPTLPLAASLALSIGVLRRESALAQRILRRLHFH